MKKSALLRKLSVATCVVAASLSVSFAAYAGDWVEDGRGWMYRYEDGTYHYGWLELGNKWYYLDSSGHCVTNQSMTINGRSYLFDENGVMQDNGWNHTDKGWYYLNYQGVKQTGWHLIGGKWYYLDPNQDGLMLTGWQNINNTWYFFYDSGDMATGWLNNYNGYTYYLLSDGAMATGWVNIDGGRYLFNSNGEWIPDSDGGQQQMVTETEELLYNQALEDMTWDEVESLANRFYVNFGSTPADAIAKLNLVRKQEKLSDLQFSTKLTKSAYALCITQRAWGFEGSYDFDETDNLEYETALKIFDAESLALDVTIARGATLNDALNTIIGTQRGVDMLSNAKADTAGVGFIRSAENGDYIVVVYTGRSGN